MKDAPGPERGPGDGADARLESDRLQPELPLAAPADRRHDVFERQHDRYVVAAPCAGRELRERLPPSLARESGGRI